MDTELVDRIYEAAVVPELWPDVLSELSNMTDAKGGLLFSARDRVLSWTATDNLYELFETYVVDGWFRRCGRRVCMFENAHSAFLIEQDYWSEEELEKNEIYRDFFRPRGLGWSAGTGLQMPTGDQIVFSVERAFESGPMKKEQIEILNGYRPHLARSAMIAARLGLKSAQGANETLAKLGIPTILLKADCSVIEMCNLPEDLHDNLVTGTSDRLALIDPLANEFLQSALLKLRAGADMAVSSFPLRDELGQATHVAHIIPVNRSAHDLFANAYALLVMIPVTAKSVPPVDLVRSLFDLTAAEARVARELASGRSVEEIAGSAGISQNTVRTHIRKVLEKTGCARQAEVVALMANIAFERELAENGTD